MSSMSDKECCKQYEIDYKKVVQEIQETLYKREEDLKNNLRNCNLPDLYSIQNLLDKNLLENNVFENNYINKIQ